MASYRDHTSAAFSAAAVAVLLALTGIASISSGENQPPTISVPGYPAVPQNVLTLFAVNAADSDGDQLRFTWFWGDGKLSVTTVPQAIHAYSMRRTYTLTVWADDQTGLADHNVSGSNYVVIAGSPRAPVIMSFSAFPLTAEIGSVVTFTGVVYDFDGGVLRMTYDYGGGAYDVWQSHSTISGEVVTHNETHVFATAGMKTVCLSVVDRFNLNTTLSPGIVVEIVVPNQKPQVAPLVPISSYTGASLTLSGEAYDADNAVLRYTWDLGDGSAPRVGQSITYTYSRVGTFTVTLYVDDLTGIPDHNVSVSATARIDYRLNLVAGWNLISLPMVTTYKASTLGLSAGDQVVRWEGQYRTFIVGLPINDFPIEPSTGYWIYTSTAKTLTLQGTTPTAQQSRHIVVPAGGGWALLGMCSMKTTWKASDLASMYSGGALTAVVRYTAAGTIPPIEPFYTTYVVGLPLNNFYLVPGAGYWIFVTASGTLTYEP